VLDVLAAVRLVATKLPVAARPRAAARTRYRFAALLDSLEPDFVPELLKETRRRISKDPTFAADIAESRGGVTKLHGRVDALRREVAGTVHAELADDPDLPLVLRANDQQDEVIGIIVVVLVLAATAVWYAYEKTKDE
jgi:hypothetical protein